MDKYCVITLDLIDSRHLEERGLVQERIKEILISINRKFEQVIRVPFNFTLGDEVQVVLDSLDQSYSLIREFQRLFPGGKFYAGIGYGSIVTELSERSIDMDGPAFHLARASIDEVKANYESNKSHFTSLIRYSFPYDELTEIVNRYLEMVEVLKYRLTDKQREVYWLLFETETYSEIAERLDQSKSAITQKIQAGYIKEILSGEEGLIQLLTRIEKGEKMND